MENGNSMKSDVG